MEQIYDMIVIGGGPAGYTAALYAARAGLSTLVLEKLSAGGQMALTELIDNYPGFESGIDGFTLGEKMQQSAERFGAVTELAEVYKASLSGKIKTLETSEGVFQGRTVVIATGASPRPLGIPGEEVLVGKGVHYCAACDGAPYRGKTVAVVGGGNSAAADALALSRIAQSRGDSLQADFYHKSYLHHLSVLRQEKEQNQITQLLRTSEQKEWEKRLTDSQKAQKEQIYVWVTLLVSCSTGIWGYSRYRQKRNVVSLSETDFFSSEIYLRFHRKEEWKPVPKDWEELLQAFNRTYPDFRERLKRKIPKLSEQEWRMCCLIKMEVPPSTAAMLLCCTNQAISMRRVRLYQKITGEKGTPELCDSFIRDF